MESTSPMFFLSQIEDRLGEPLREGQREVIERFFVVASVVAQLPTGLGKTRAAAAAYAVLRQQNLVNRVLYIVPVVPKQTKPLTSFHATWVQFWIWG